MFHISVTEGGIQQLSRGEATMAPRSQVQQVAQCYGMPGADINLHPPQLWAGTSSRLASGAQPSQAEEHGGRFNK